MHLLKYQQVRPAANVLGRMLAEVVAGLEISLPAGMIAVVPVPLHFRKRAQRGFNQAELIARYAVNKLARADRFQIVADVLIRSRETGSQIGLTKHQRRENLRGAFKVNAPERIAGRSVLLVGDTSTPSSACSSVALGLRDHGPALVSPCSPGGRRR